MNNKVKNIALEYIEEINRDIVQLDELLFCVSGRNDQDLVDDLYKSSIFKMCIKYESFASEAMICLFPDKKIEYNHPWSYTRKLSTVLNLNIQKEYKKAHDAWYIYNSLKHINYKTKLKREKEFSKHKIKNLKEASKFIHKILIELLRKFT